MSKKTLLRIGLMAVAAVAAAAVIGWYLSALKPDKNIREQTFAWLEDIRSQRKHDIIDYFEKIHRQAEDVTRDRGMVRYFELLQQNSAVDAQLEFEIDNHYVRQFSNFYDVLFVDTTGYVFHSIKEESDYRKNLFEGNLLNPSLLDQMRASNSQFFINFRYYRPSNRPAAFFAVPYLREGMHRGWFLLQCSLNRINVILTDHRQLSRTGESI